MKRIISLTSLLILLTSCQPDKSFIYNYQNINWDEFEYGECIKERAELIILCKLEKGSQVETKKFYVRKTRVDYQVCKGPDGKTFRTRAMPSPPPIISKSTCASGPNGSYRSSYVDSSGVGEFNKEGFRISLCFSYSGNAGKNFSVDESFNCKWLEHQVIQKEDIQLTVEIKEYKPEQKNSGNGVPPSQI